MNSKSKVSFKKRTISLCLLASLIGFTPIKTNSIPILQHVTAVKGVQASERNISKVDYSKDVIYQIITDRFFIMWVSNVLFNIIDHLHDHDIGTTMLFPF